MFLSGDISSTVCKTDIYKQDLFDSFLVFIPFGNEDDCNSSDL